MGITREEMREGKLVRTYCMNKIIIKDFFLGGIRFSELKCKVSSSARNGHTCYYCFSKCHL